MTNTVNGGYLQNIQSNPYGGDVNRGTFGQMFNGKDIAKEDWYRAEQSANNAMYRDLYMQEQANAFSAEQAELAFQREAGEAQKDRDWQSSEEQKRRDWEEHMADNEYLRKVEQLKASGLSPVLAFGGSGSTWHGTSASGGSRASSSSPSGSSAGSSGGHSAGSFSSDSLGQLLGTALQVGAGLITKGMTSKSLIKKIF